MTTTDQRAGYTAGLRALADLIDGSPHLFADIQYSLDQFLVPVSSAADPRAHLAGWIRAAKAAALPVRKDYDDKWGSVDVDFGAFVVHVYAHREQVCDRVVTGTREVTREIPDPDALAAIPTTTVTETVEDVEWVCRPLLADEPVPA